MALSHLQPEAVLSSLSQAGLLPSPVIPATFQPSVQLSVSFSEKQVAAGNLFRVSEVQSTPIISFTPEHGHTGGDETKYTVMLVDPDAPTPQDPKFAYWRHWIVSGLRPSSTSATGKSLTDYLAPGPKDDSKPHRYHFLLYREPQGFSLEKGDVGGEEFVERRSFGVQEFVKKHGLELVGVNWMLGAGDGWSEEKSEL